MQNHQFIKFIKYVEQVKKIKFINPNIFHNWAIKNIDELWSNIWDYTGIIGDKNDHKSLSDSKKYLQDIRFLKKQKSVTLKI